MENTTQSIRFTLTATDEGVPQLALLANEFEITNPFVTECGRFHAEPERNYGVSPTLAYFIARLNQQLRFESGVENEGPVPGDDLPSQRQYVQSGFNACPQCGSHDIRGDAIEVAGNTAYQDVSCNTCAAAWNDRYQLVGYEITDVGSDRDVRIALIQEQIKEMSGKVAAAQALLAGFGPSIKALDSLERLLASQKQLIDQLMLLENSVPE